MSMILDVLVLKGQRYGGTIKSSNPEACIFLTLFALLSACIVDVRYA